MNGEFNLSLLSCEDEARWYGSTQDVSGGDHYDPGSRTGYTTPGASHGRLRWKSQGGNGFHSESLGMY